MPFEKGNQAAKKKGKHKRTLIIDALKASGKTEEDFFEAMVEKALFGGSDGDGDGQMMREVAARLYPVSKSTLPTYDFKFPDDGTMLEKADAIINAVGQGQLPIDAAKSFMDLIESRASIEEKEELADRVNRLEEMLNADSV